MGQNEIMTLYEIQGLKKSFGKKQVLNINQLKINQGIIYALAGPNGAGKTTLLNILAFLDIPTLGKLYFCGSSIQFCEKQMLKLRRQVIMLDQHPIMFSSSVFKNIEFGLKIRKIEKKEREKRIDQVLDMVGMKEFKNRRAKDLSGGETQRIALARVLALKPQILLCDEPTSSVDIYNQKIIIDLLKELNKEGVSIIFTTHDPRLTKLLADETIALDMGTILP